METIPEGRWREREKQGLTVCDQASLLLPKRARLLSWHITTWGVHSVALCVVIGAISWRLGEKKTGWRRNACCVVVGLLRLPGLLFQVESVPVRSQLC